MKSKEEYTEGYIEYLYRDVLEHDKEIYAPDIQQTKADFKAGFDLAEELFKPKWVSVDIQPKDEDTYIIKIKDYRRPQENVTEIGLGYFDQEEKEWYHTSDVLVNGGHGWMITHYMKLPKDEK